MHVEQLGDESGLREQPIAFVKRFYLVLHVHVGVCEVLVHFYYVFVIGVDDVLGLESLACC